MNLIPNLLLIALIVAIGRSEDQSEDCIVNRKLVCDITSADTFEWKAYFTNETKLEIYVAFVEKEDVSDRDCIHFKMNEVYRDKKRNHEYLEIDNLPNASLSLEWSNFSIAVVEKGTIAVKINSVIFPIEFDYPVRYLSIASDNLAACSKGRPTWEITEGKNTTIPINQHENVHFSLNSSKSFSPAFYMNDLLINLQFNSGVEIGNSKNARPLPEGIYDFILKKEANTWILLHKQPNEDFEVLLEFKMTDELFNICLTSFEEDFHFQFKPTKSDLEKGIPSIICPINNDYTSFEITAIALIPVLLLCIIILLILLLLKPKKIQETLKTKDSEQSGKLIEHS